ncbi:MAG: TonB-dependent receptor [Prevotellaceae bacterium]|jgi:outer membrane receptor for ferrienterochelin and colicin|nr:TonB-dependent receptor [Prevotellaceae bacterium]
MIKNIYFVLILLQLSVFGAEAQNVKNITGHVYTVNSSGAKEPLEGAIVYLSDSKKGTASGVEGKYSIEAPAGEEYLIASLIGFVSDSLKVSGDGVADFVLVEKGLMLEETVIVARRQGTYFSKIAPAKVEVISQTGLMKLACCNLGESFENSASVTVGFTDAVSGAKQIQLLGLSGIYSQMMSENIPTMRGLASTYGWNYVPGSWMEGIQISKGASSVVYGYESVSGQINLDFKKPNHSEPFFMNLYADATGRYEANISAATKVVPDRLWTGLLAHASTEMLEHDENKDGFMDIPKAKLFNLYNRWYYENPEKGVESKTGIKFLNEIRNGGQMSSVQNRYTTDIENTNINVYNKTGFAFGKEGQSLGIINSFTRHTQSSEFGLKKFDGAQNTMYSNLLFASYINNTSHQYTAGASFLYDSYKMSYQDKLPYNTLTDINLDREEFVPGVFAQYTYSYLDRFTFILGARSDYNSRFGWLFTPRTNVKYNITDAVVFRASAGKGYRSPSVIAENIGLMASSREFDAAAIKNLDIENAWNYGTNLTFYIPTWNENKLVLSIDYFRTDFINQSVIDIERDPDKVFFYNLNGKSYANAWQADLTFAPFKGMEIFAAYRFNDTKITTGDGNSSYLLEKPLTSRYRALLNVSYATNFRKWVFDLTAQLNGKTRLPSMNGYSREVNTSPAFPIYFAQVTKNTKYFDVYAGVENIFDYRQKNPIVMPDKPFDRGFDSSLIWGPLMGRRIYAGIRLRIGSQVY